MTIKELNHKPEYNIKDATVCLTYEEIKDVNRALSFILNTQHRREPSEIEKESLSKTKQRFGILFDIIKNGCLSQEIIDKYATKGE